MQDHTKNTSRDEASSARQLLEWFRPKRHRTGGGVRKADGSPLIPLDRSGVVHEFRASSRHVCPAEFNMTCDNSGQ